GPGLDSFAPALICDVPRDGLAQAGCERLARAPAQVKPRLRGVNRIPQVVPWTVIDKGDQRLPVGVCVIGGELVDSGANGLYNVQIPTFTPTSDVVRLPRHATLEGRSECPCVVLHEQPIPHVLSTAVHPDRLPLKCSLNCEGNELLRKLVRPVVVGGI